MPRAAFSGKRVRLPSRVQVQTERERLRRSGHRSARMLRVVFGVMLLAVIVLLTISLRRVSKTEKESQTAVLVSMALTAMQTCG